MKPQRPSRCFFSWRPRRPWPRLCWHSRPSVGGRSRSEGHTYVLRAVFRRPCQDVGSVHAPRVAPSRRNPCRQRTLPIRRRLARRWVARLFSTRRLGVARWSPLGRLRWRSCNVSGGCQRCRLSRTCAAGDVFLFPTRSFRVRNGRWLPRPETCYVTLSAMRREGKRPLGSRAASDMTRWFVSVEEFAVLCEASATVSLPSHYRRFNSQAECHVLTVIKTSYYQNALPPIEGWAW